MCLSRQIDIFDWYILSPHLSSYYCVRLSIVQPFHRCLAGDQWIMVRFLTHCGHFEFKIAVEAKRYKLSDSIDGIIVTKKFQPTFLNDLESGDDDSDAHVTEVRCRVGIFRRNEFIRIRNPQNRIISDEGLSTGKLVYSMQS